MFKPKTMIQNIYTYCCLLGLGEEQDKQWKINYSEEGTAAFCPKALCLNVRLKLCEM